MYPKYFTLQEQEMLDLIIKKATDLKESDITVTNIIIPKDDPYYICVEIDTDEFSHREIAFINTLNTNYLKDTKLCVGLSHTKDNLQGTSIY